MTRAEPQQRGIGADLKVLAPRPRAVNDDPVGSQGADIEVECGGADALTSPTHTTKY